MKIAHTAFQFLLSSSLPTLAIVCVFTGIPFLGTWGPYAEQLGWPR